MSTAKPFAPQALASLPRARASLLALGLLAAFALLYGIRFNVPPVVSLQMIADPLTQIDDIEARHLTNSPLWLWVAHALGVKTYSAWALVSAGLTGLACIGLVAHVFASFRTDAERATALLLLSVSPIFFHMLGWSAKGEALIVLAFLGLLWAPHAAIAGACASLMVLALPVEALGMIFLTLLWKRPAPLRAAAIAAGTAIGIGVHTAWLFAVGDVANFTFHAKGFLAEGDQRSALWFLASLWLELGWFWLVIAYAARIGLLRRSELALVATGALLSLASTVPERPGVLVALPFIFMLIERLLAHGFRPRGSIVALMAVLALIQAEAAWVDGATRLHVSHWPGTLEQLRQWAK